MQIKEDFILREVGENYIIVPIGAQTIDFRSIVTLNETGAFLWKQLEEDKDEDQLVAALLGEYDVTEETARADVAKFASELRQADLLR